MIEFPAPLPDEVTKVQDGMYLYRGVYLRFNRMELHSKWTAHYRKSEPIIDRIEGSNTIRNLIHYVNIYYENLAGECQVDGFCDPA